MNNETTGANTAVETPSTATEQEVAIPSAGPERIEWQKTGELPKAASTPAPEGEQSPKSAPASEAGKPTQEKKSLSAAAQRVEELLADIKAAGFDGPGDLKTFRREAVKPTQAESSPAKQPEVKAAPVTKLEAPKEPDMKDPAFQGADGWEKYEAAVRQYNKDNAKYESALAVETYKRDQAQQQQLQTVLAQIETGRKTYADFDTKTAPVFQALIADLNSPVSEMVGESPVFEHLMYVIGGEGEEFLALVKSNPKLALKKAVLLESLVMAELAKGKGATEEKPRGDNGQFLPPEKKSKAVSDAPEPPHEVGGKGTPQADEAENALKSGDMRKYMDVENRRDLARRKG